MSLETGSYIADLVSTNPTSSDQKSQGDDHIRLIKAVLQNSFAGFTGAIFVTGSDSGSANTYTITPATALTAYSTKLVVAFSPVATNTSASTLNISGLGAKSIKSISGDALASGELVSGSLYIAIYNGTEFRLLSPTKGYIDQLAFDTALPNQTGNADKVPTTDGTNVLWTDSLKASVIRFVDGTDTTKKLAFNVSGITTGTTRTLTVPDANATVLTTASPVTVPQGGTGASTFTDGGVLIGNAAGSIQSTSAGTSGQVLTSNGAGIDPTFQALPADGWTLLSVVSASNSATVDVETTFDSTYDTYLITGTSIVAQTNGVTLNAQMKIGGAYISTSTYKYHTTRVESNDTTYKGTAPLNDSKIILTGAMGNNSDQSCDLSMFIHAPAGTARQKKIYWQGILDNTAIVAFSGGGANSGTDALTGIRFAMSSGNIVSGNFRLYGIRKT